MRVALAVLLLLPSALPASAQEMPTPKPGLWEMTVTEANAPTRIVQHCVDDTAIKAMRLIWWHPDQKVCTSPQISRSSSAITVDRMCQLGGSKTTDRAVVTGNLNSAYMVALTVSEFISAESTMVTEGPSGLISRKGPFTWDRLTTIEAKWLGECTVYMEPGEIFTVGGKRHIREWPHLLAPEAQRR